MANKLTKTDLAKIKKLQRQIDKILFKYEEKEDSLQGLLSVASCALETIAIYSE